MQKFLDLCKDTSSTLPSVRNQKIFADPRLKKNIQAIETALDQVFEVYTPKNLPPPLASPRLKAVTWNIERGKNLESVLHLLQTHPFLKAADFLFLTEVDWGMARSENKNVAAEIGKSLNYYSYFAPSYYNLTQGHGSERTKLGKNQEGLHGKAILSRFPLQNLRLIRMPNATNKLQSKEARIGQKRALLGEFHQNGSAIHLACIHLDAFSSPQSRTTQIRQVLQELSPHYFSLLGGDWNTNTFNTTGGLSLFKDILKTLLKPGPRQMVAKHFRAPNLHFDKNLFSELEEWGFDYESVNEKARGTFDLFFDDAELGKMAEDQYPRWLIHFIHKILKKLGGEISLKLDWFAGKNLKVIEKKVIPLKSSDYSPHTRPSDHHPIYLEFEMEAP